MKKTLTHNLEMEVKFSEADPLGIVWHGHYIRYFEDGREAFGAAYGLRYLDLFREDIVVPIVSIHCDYKRILRYSHRVRLETTYIDTPAAKMLFAYGMYDMANGVLVAKGSSIQVFMQREQMDLMLTVPPFMQNWKEKWLRGDDESGERHQ